MLHFMLGPAFLLGVPAPNTLSAVVSLEAQKELVNARSEIVALQAKLVGAHSQIAALRAEKTRNTYREGSGVSSLLKDLGCGMANMEVPHFLTLPGFGANRVMVDVGLNEGKETIAAVKSGFTVYSFEPVEEFVVQVAADLEQEGLDFQRIQLNDQGNLLEPLRAPTKGKGISYLFQVAAGRKHDWMNISVEGPGTSFVDPKNRNKKDRPTQIVPIAEYIKSDVYFFKTDTQGFEMEVLAGARALFLDYSVRLITTELFPQGLQAAGSSSSSLVDFLTNELNLICFSGEPEANGFRNMPAGHPEGMDAFLDAIEERQVLQTQDVGGRYDRWGVFDDLTCLNKDIGSLDAQSRRGGTM